MVLALAARGEIGHDTPVALCIASAETFEVWQVHLEEVLAAAGVDAKDVAFMIDKSRTKMSAIRAIGVTLLLCHFHMLQEADRFPRSSDSGMSGPPTRRCA